MSAGIPQSIKSEVRRSACGGVQLFLGSLVTALLIAILIAGAGISISPTRSNAAPAGELVNRTSKTDRWALRSRSLRMNSKLPSGCEPLVSPLADTQLARLARQCVS